MSTFCITSTKSGFLKGKSPLKLGITSDFITQSKPLRILPKPEVFGMDNCNFFLLLTGNVY
ncbi:MAG: hypothetical protein EWV75_07955 [Microcystis wesenbergii Mw_QC_S_20081001_S30D]|uniref:Uncharacterized protein n=1 Tax=Microcystis wesenbergii Mw_QC_S_20081001_S30D TaxID=2486245 RepID=A0A552JQK9_9CHRO|nr:MAG: hypothetical protein EWV75_07955 [Microcystis wesenbergii Mw_QC_S_20081001_S30D]TRU98457.1 MAG: hypothetical protein EWV74_15765 [Microcystis wesenbergii Mw_QC_S_20081001_S30]TRU99217.1 MAG: hypothetical protein EWV73_13675 [Microcystis wesenbergii Mw_QC_B_20070930_S4D]TRV16726.1 MAG: hypothetical protein EWV89_05005 [Microcystis wesenbergii Mw_QC_B_20070930_S4]